MAFKYCYADDTACKCFGGLKAQPAIYILCCKLRRGLLPLENRHCRLQADPWKEEQQDYLCPPSTHYFDLEICVISPSPSSAFLATIYSPWKELIG